ncbi:hypothetical protein RMATCC62417_15094 [Rhizopus microsporus]|nr:hypothetical protein RMATCC62417_15094 [Rhizopus microsporus]
MLYFVHENSTPEQLVQFRYTKQQQDKTWKTKKYRRILQGLKAQDPDVVQAEQALSKQPSSTVSVEDFGRFLQARSEQSVVLSRFYGHTITNHDEYKTSKCCPTCHNESLRTFRCVPNPRPYQRERYPMVVCHGLLRCINLYCRPTMAASDRYRLWNRDVAACLNYVHILRGLRRNGMVPHRLRRVAVAPIRRRRRVDDQEQPRTRIRLDDDSPY